MKNVQSAIVLGIMCFMLSFGIAVQISSIKNDSTVVAKENTENHLRDEVLQLNEEYKKAYSKLEKRQKVLESLRQEASNSNDISANWSEDLGKINNFLGLTNVKGSGIIIKLDNGDLLQIINALNNAGAEAIAINEIRLAFNSEIVMDGDICSLDGNTLETPYNIKAIGSKTLKGAVSMPGSYIDILKRKGHDITITENDEIIIKKYDGIYNFNFAKNVEN